MNGQIFINLPVQDLRKAKMFYSKLGFAINLRYSDETAACVVLSEQINVMLLTHEKFKLFTPKKIANSTITTEVLNAIQVDLKEMVDKIANSAIDAGGKEVRDIQDHGFMYGRSFEDLDGHIWEVFWMDHSQLP